MSKRSTSAMCFAPLAIVWALLFVQLIHVNADSPTTEATVAPSTQSSSSSPTTISSTLTPSTPSTTTKTTPSTNAAAAPQFTLIIHEYVHVWLNWNYNLTCDNATKYWEINGTSYEKMKPDLDTRGITLINTTTNSIMALTKSDYYSSGNYTCYSNGTSQIWIVRSSATSFVANVNVISLICIAAVFCSMKLFN